MRTSIASATFLLLGAGAAAVGATSGDNLALNGSDTLFQVTNKVMSLCNGIVGHGLTYAGGGSGVGAAQMDLQLQEMAPMSRALKSTEYCNNATSSPPITTQGTTNALMVGIDGVSIMANSARVCSPDLAQNGRTFQYTNGSGTHTYTIGSSLDVLRLVYAGTDSTGSYTGDYGCGGPIRKALVSNWQALFNANCGSAPNCPAEYTVGGVTTDVTAGLTHAWRRSDLSGTTDAFVSLVNLGSRKIGPNPAAPGAGTSSNPLAVNPFCNSKDAQDSTNATKSFAGASDYADNDPIRVTCDDNDTVCGKDNALGLVLPVLLPDVPGVATTDTYPTVACGTFCALSDPGDPNQPCPRGGPKKLGRCYQPAIKNADGSFNFQCVADLSKSCFGDQGVDGRAYNLPLKQKQGSEGAEYVVDSNGNLMAGSFFRMHMAKPSTYAAGNPTCQFSDDTQQIGCLVNGDPCSIGFAGREADAQTGNQALSVNGIIPKDPAGHPSDPDFFIENLLTGVSKCSTSADCSGQAGGKTSCLLGQCYNLATNPVYPISRRLYVASLVGFGNLPGGEKQLGLCFGDNNIVKTAITANNFVLVPGGVQCLDYPELDSSQPQSAFLPTCGGASSGGANSNACTGAAAPTIVN